MFFWATLCCFLYLWRHWRSLAIWWLWWCLMLYGCIVSTLRYSRRINSFGTTGGTEVIQERVLLVHRCRRVQNHCSILCRFPRLRLELCISAHQLFLAFSYAFHSILVLGRSRNWMMPVPPRGATPRGSIGFWKLSDAHDDDEERREEDNTT